MRFLFRTDANAQIGTGHLMRCLALARALRARGAECVFLCRSAGLGSLTSRIVGEGHALLALPDADSKHVDSDVSAHAHWLPGGWRSDVDACKHVLEGTPSADWLVIDHYALDHRWQSAMRFSAQKIMVIDDLADRQHNCDLLLDQNLIDVMEHRYDGLVPNHCMRLLGPRYALLRQEFERNTSDVERSPGRTVQPRLLVMFGGADAGNLTLRTVQALIRLRWSGPVDVVAGPLYAHLPELSAAMAGLSAAVLHTSADNIAQLMCRSDLAVGSPGVTSWERCACALPAVVIAQADNQESIGRALAVAAAHFYLGRAEQVTDESFEAALRTWLDNLPARIAMSRLAATICDGKGLRRVVRRLMPLAITIRRATIEDANLLFTWRNDERIRGQSLDSRLLDRGVHQTWIERAVAGHDVALLVACLDQVPVACVRFNFNGVRGRVSIYTDPDLQGKGVGSHSLIAALGWLKVEYPWIEVTEAEVLLANEASHAMFRDAGYHPLLTRYERDQESEC